MEYLNKIELKGVVGRVSQHPVGVSVIVRFSVATNYAYHSADGSPVIDTTWHNCVYITDADTASTIEKGEQVYLTGRLRAQSYTDAEGACRTCYETLVNNLKIIAL